MAQNRAFDALTVAEADKAKLSDQVDELKEELDQVRKENESLHQVAQDRSFQKTEQSHINQILSLRTSFFKQGIL